MTGKFTLRFEPLSCAKMQQRQNELLKTCIFGLFKNSYFRVPKSPHRIHLNDNLNFEAQNLESENSWNSA